MTTTVAPARVPRLASDIARSWVAIGIGMPFMIILPTLAVVLQVWAPEDIANGYLELLSSLFYVVWTIFSLATVVVTYRVFRRATARELREWLDATAAPEGRLRRFWWSFNGGGATTWGLTGSVIALGALLELSLSGREVPLFVTLAAIAVVPASISVIIVTFAVSHARADRDRGFVFPGDDEPRFADYLYLSVQLTTTFGGSDVAVTTTRLRRAVSFHSLMAFAYNAFIVALLVSVLIGVVGR